jgi:rhodanese-related sulfurtransferase
LKNKFNKRLLIFSQRNYKPVVLKIKTMEHSKEFEELVSSIKAEVREISVAETEERVKQGAALIDVREDNEWNDSHAAGAQHIGRGVIERDIVHKFPDKQTELVLYCGGGYRSALATVNLQKMGYTNVFSMAGGWTAWQAANAPIVKTK